MGYVKTALLDTVGFGRNRRISDQFGISIIHNRYFEHRHMSGRSKREEVATLPDHI